jgi:predicted porin
LEIIDMKKSILLATSAIIAAGAVATSAHAIDVELYGQVNKGVMFTNVDNGTNVDIVDNNFSSTRFGLRGNQQLSHGLTASVLLEGELQGANASNAVNDSSLTSNNTDTDPSTWQTRHARVGIGGQFGALFIGRTSSATDGIAEIDLGAARDVMGSAIDRIGGGAVVVTDAGASTLNRTLSSLTDNIDGVGYVGGSADTDGDFDAFQDRHDADRVNLVRFDTPIVEGLQARVAYIQGDDIDAALLYNNSFAGFEVAGGIGYVNYGKDRALTLEQDAVDLQEVRHSWAASASVLHDSGLSLTGSWGTRRVANKDTAQKNPNAWYLKAGYQYNNTGVAVDFAQNRNANAGQTAFTDLGQTRVISYGAAVQQDLGHGVSAAAYFRHFDVDTNRNDVAANQGENAQVFGVNMRVKF